MSITGRIENWEIISSSTFGSQFIVGNIYEDVHGRFPDGSEIISSKLLPMSMQVSSPKEGVVMHTRNSQYLLGKPKQGESCE